MKFIERFKLSESEKLQVLELWNNEYPENLSYESIEELDEYLQKLTEQSHLLLIDSDNKIKGWYFDFKRENAKWFAIILDTSIQGKGLGTKILKLAQKKENELNGWVIDHNRDKRKNGEFYYSPLNFYITNGFKKMSTERLELNNISAVKIQWKK